MMKVSGWRLHFVYEWSKKNHVVFETLQNLTVDIANSRVISTLGHISNDKSPSWYGLTIKYFNKHMLGLKTPFTMLFQEV